MIAGFHRWAPAYQGTHVHVITDNMQVLAKINTGQTFNKTCMTWLRELFWICFVNNIDVFATYIKPEDNVLADTLYHAAYSDVTQKCINLLVDFSMCCSSTYRADAQELEISSAHSSRCCMGSLDQDGKEIQAVVL